MPPDQLALKNDSTGPEGHVQTQVLRELSAAGIGEQTLNTEGLRITTTIDPVAQQAAIDNARSVLDGEDESLRTAVVSIDPRTGAVRCARTTAVRRERGSISRRRRCRPVRRSRSSVWLRRCSRESD